MAAANFLCSICFNPIMLGNYQIDEGGWPVHKKYYEERARHTALVNKKPPKKKTAIWATWRRVE